MCVTSAVVYGIIHDQFTARICVEYFTVGHPPVFATDNPTVLGIGWGIIATWWVGVLLGVPLAVCARSGRRPKLSPSELVRPLLILLASLGILAFLAGAAGHFAAERDLVRLLEPMASRVPAARHVAFITSLWTHLASYLGGFVGGVVICAWALKRRTQQAIALSVR
ncbi:hypothetical protein BH09PLA1_BH09PLA1_07790 [soil metagenome]